MSPRTKTPLQRPAQPLKDPSHLVIGRAVPPLEPLFAPKCVAVVGASERPGSVGRALLSNLLASPFGGTVYPVNAKRSAVLGVQAFPDLSSLPQRPDLAVIAAPAAQVPGVMREAAKLGVKAAIVISAGFKECGPEGAALEWEVAEAAKQGGIRVLGPNCLGLMRPSSGLNASFASRLARPGHVALLSQSGALLTAILDWAEQEQVGFSSVVSTGSLLDLGWGDLIDHLGDDPETRAILLYMESVGDARRFLSAAREVALAKPILVLKAGRSAQGAKAAASHTGALTGSDAVLDAAFQRAGILRVDSIGQLFDLAEALAKQPLPRGRRLSVLTNAGGPGVLAADALARHHGELAPLAEETVAKLDQQLPPQWSHHNPIDILGDAPPERFEKALEAALADPNSDGLLAILTPQAMTQPTATAQLLAKHAKTQPKPVLACWMGGSDTAPGVQLLQGAGIPCLPYPDDAAAMFCRLWAYSHRLQALYETPSLEDAPEKALQRAAQAQALLKPAAEAKRVLLSEHESKAILGAYGIPVSQTRLAQSPADAMAAARFVGFPVAVKLHSHTLTHKAEVGGVRLGLQTAEEVAEAFASIRRAVELKAGDGHFLGVTVQPMARPEGIELILGMSVDPQFGPVLLFGAGGSHVELLRDRALALPPLNSTLARRLMEQTRIYEALKGRPGQASVDLRKLEELLVRFSQLVLDLPRLAEVDLNPILATPSGVLALDARMVLHPASLSDHQLPRPALRPYPAQYIQPWRGPSGEEITLRPIRPEDEPGLVAFHEALSERSVYQRYFHVLGLSQRVAHERMVRVCMNDYDRQIAIVAERAAPSSAPGGRGASSPLLRRGEGNSDAGPGEILAVGRLTRLPGGQEAEFALLVADAYQGRGLGTQLLKRLLEVGRAEGIKVVRAQIFPDNGAMQAVCGKLGFTMKRDEGMGLVLAGVGL